jgi:hypothetical protein
MGVCRVGVTLVPVIKCATKVGEVQEFNVEFIPPGGQRNGTVSEAQPLTAVIAIVATPGDPYKWQLVKPDKKHAELRSTDASNAVPIPCGADLSMYMAVQLQDEYGNVIDLKNLHGGDGSGALLRRRKVLPSALMPWLVVERDVSQEPGMSAASSRFECTEFKLDNPEAILPVNAVLEGAAGVWKVVVQSYEERLCEEVKREASGDDEGDGQDAPRAPGGQASPAKKRRSAEGILASKVHVCLKAGKPKFLQVLVQRQQAEHADQGGGAHPATHKFGGMPAQPGQNANGQQGEGPLGLHNVPSTAVMPRIVVNILDQHGNLISSPAGENKKALQSQSVTLLMQGGTIANAAHIKKAFVQKGGNYAAEFKDVLLSTGDEEIQENGANASQIGSALLVKSNIAGVQDVKIPVTFVPTNAVVGLQCSLDPHQQVIRAGEVLSSLLVKVSTKDKAPLDRQLGAQNTTITCRRCGVDAAGEDAASEITAVPHDLEPNSFVAW